MTLLESLQSLLKVSVDISNLKSIHLFSNNKSTKTHYIDNRTININIAAVKAEDIPKLQETVKHALQQQDALVIEKTANNLLTDISRVQADVQTNELIEFFKGKISNTDLEILKASLYVKDVYDRGDSVAELKHDISLKYGERGRNIVNLCTAGYFITIIKPLYLEMVQQPDFTPSLFLETFNIIVNQSPFAIFVNSHTTSEQLLSDVEMKMEINKTYGIDYLNIHGIGDGNVSKIEELLIKLKGKFTYTPDIVSGRGYITVTIYF